MAGAATHVPRLLLPPPAAAYYGVLIRAHAAGFGTSTFFPVAVHAVNFVALPGPVLACMRWSVQLFCIGDACQIRARLVCNTRTASVSPFDESDFCRSLFY
jgi:hypothetical protein